MTQSTTRQWSTEKLLLVIGIIAILAGIAIGTSVGYAVRYEAPTTRTFYLFNSSLNFDEELWGVSHDTFSPDRITVNKADKVVIIYRNIEDQNEDHTFTMEAPYTMNHVLPADTTTEFSFNATASGSFAYRCTYHQPTMTGWLTVRDCSA